MRRRGKEKKRGMRGGNEKEIAIFEIGSTRRKEEETVPSAKNQGRKGETKISLRYYEIGDEWRDCTCDQPLSKLRIFSSN